MIVPALVMIALLGGITLYFARRTAQCVQYLLPRFPFWASLAVFAVLTAVLAVGFVRSTMPLPPVLKSLLKVLSAYWMGAFVYLLLYLLAADIVVFAGWLVRIIPHPVPGAVRFASILTALILTVSTCAYGFWHASHLHQKTYDVRLPGLEKEMTIALASDLHLGAVGSERRLGHTVEALNAMDADIICLAGDLFDNDFAAIEDPERAAQQLRSLAAKHGVYACLGNHDAGRTFDEMVSFLENCGVQLLSEAYTVIDGRLVLAGRADRSPIGGSRMRRGELSAVLNGAPEMPVVVMDHNPAKAEGYGSAADLVLSGHTHKGQIFPGSLITGRMYAVDYGYGRLENGPQIVVTSGAGTWGLPMRVGTDCEVVLVKLKPE